MDASVLMKRLEDNLDIIFDEEKYKEFLSYVARFHRYSPFNQLLIVLQKPDAFKVAGYRKWIEEGRQVKKGEKAIGILAPKFYNVYTDVKTGERLKKNAMSRSELKKAIEFGLVEVEKKQFGYLGVSVFDISQTIPIKGEDNEDEIRMSVEGLKGSFKDLDKLVKAVKIATEAEVRITKELNTLDIMGYYDVVNNLIVVRELDGVQIASTLIHEAGHAIARRLTKDGKIIPLRDKEKVEDKDLAIISREDEEVIVESAAYAVMQELGMDVSGYSFGYIHNWATAYREDKKEARESILNNLKYISAITSEILNAMEIVFGVTSDTEDKMAIQEEKAEELLTMIEANTVRLKASGEMRVQ
jgi:hypothetical protein